MVMIYEQLKQLITDAIKDFNIKILSDLIRCKKPNKMTKKAGVTFCLMLSAFRQDFDALDRLYDWDSVLDYL